MSLFMVTSFFACTGGLPSIMLAWFKLSLMTQSRRPAASRKARRLRRSRGIQDGVLHLQEVGKGALKLQMDALRTQIKRTEDRHVTPGIQAFLRRGDNLRVDRKPQIVVRAHVDDAAYPVGVDPSALRRSDDALLFIKPLRFYFPIASAKYPRADFIQSPSRSGLLSQLSTTLPQRPLFMTSKAFS